MAWILKCSRWATEVPPGGWFVLSVTAMHLGMLPHPALYLVPGLQGYGQETSLDANSSLEDATIFLNCTIWTADPQVCSTGFPQTKLLQHCIYSITQQSTVSERAQDGER